MPITRMRQTRAAVLLAILLVAPACARVNPNLTPQQQEQAQLRDLQRVAQVTERIGVMVLSLQQIEVTLANAGRISPEDHRIAQTYFKLSAEMVLAALDDAKDLTKPIKERSNGIVVALRMVDRLQTEVIDKLPDQQARTDLRLALVAVQAVLIAWQLQL